MQLHTEDISGTILGPEFDLQPPNYYRPSEQTWQTIVTALGCLCSLRFVNVMHCQTKPPFRSFSMQLRDAHSISLLHQQPF
jgi:hypothetical protein